MNHPSVVTLETHSAPRMLLAGAQLVPVQLPAGTRCIYPNPDLPAFSDVEGKVRSALSRPLDSLPLATRLRPGMRLTIVLADPLAPPPARSGSDIRARLLGVLLELATERRVDDIEIIIASGLERRLKPSELRRLVGSRVFNDYFPKRLRCHDAEDAAGLVPIGTLADGTPVDLNRRVVESDLTIFLAARTTLGDDAYSALAKGLSSYRTARAHLTPTAAASSPAQASGVYALRAAGLLEASRLIHEGVKLFSVEAALRSAGPLSPLLFLTKNEDDLSDRQRSLQNAFAYGAHRLPSFAQNVLFERDGVHASLIGVWAGDSALVGKASSTKIWQQSGVPITGQADVLIVPIPPSSPQNVQAFLNPLLVQALGAGYFFDKHRGKPLLKPGGTLILLHPMTDRFDHGQHVASVDFVHSVLRETRNAAELSAQHELEFSRDPALIQMYRSSYAYHPSHPFTLWYAGESGRFHAGRVIVVGADNESIPALFGFETAKTMDEAFYRARGGVPRSLDVICLKAPSLVLSDVAG